MKLIIASNNAHKAREIKQILGDRFDSIQTMKEAGIVLEVEEDGMTFRENAIKKAEETLKAAPEFDAALADDSGLCVDALNGAPGVYSARYAGEAHNDEENNSKLLNEMKGIPYAKRTCRFTTCVALASKNNETVCAEGSVEGILLDDKLGDNGFGYDPLFYYEPACKSFAQLTEEEKNAVSHRRRALENLKRYIEL